MSTDCVLGWSGSTMPGLICLCQSKPKHPQDKCCIFVVSAQIKSIKQWLCIIRRYPTGALVSNRTPLCTAKSFIEWCIIRITVHYHCHVAVDLNASLLFLRFFPVCEQMFDHRLGCHTLNGSWKYCRVRVRVTFELLYFVFQLKVLIKVFVFLSRGN